MALVNLQTKSGLVAAMLLGASLSVVPLHGGRVPRDAQAEEAKAPHEGREAEASEGRIAQLRKRLEIAPAQEAAWNGVAQIMRDNAAAFRANVPDRSKGPDTSTAVEDLKAFQIIADEHANGLRKLIPAFDALYASMPPAQQKRADQVFRMHERSSDF